MLHYDNTHICKPDTFCVEESHIVQMDLYSGYTGRSFWLPGTTPYKVRNGLIRAINGESRWPFLAVFHRFRIVIRHSRSVYTVSPKQKRPSFHAVSVEEVWAVFLSFFWRLMPQIHRFLTIKTYLKASIYPRWFVTVTVCELYSLNLNSLHYRWPSYSEMDAFLIEKCPLKELLAVTLFTDIHNPITWERVLWTIDLVY